MQKYQRQKVVGKGAFGQAILVNRRQDNKQCIVKKVSLAKMPIKEQREAEKEALLLSNLNHPNIVAYLESFVEAGSLCIVMEYADGGDLHEYLAGRKGRLLQEDQLQNWFVQMCLAMKHIHDRKILHRDLKPQNLFLTHNQRILKLGDFGIARVLAYTMEKAATMCGTPYYMSPEICKEQRYDDKSDIWSMGCILYEMAALRHAFEGRDMRSLLRRIVQGNYSPLPSQISRDIRTLVGQMLNRSPKLRPSINHILRLPFIHQRISLFLSGKEKEDEFSHTILHGRQPLLKAQNPVEKIGRKKPGAKKAPPPPPRRRQAKPARRPDKNPAAIQRKGDGGNRYRPRSKPEIPRQQPQPQPQRKPSSGAVAGGDRPPMKLRGVDPIVQAAMDRARQARKAKEQAKQAQQQVPAENDEKIPMWRRSPSREQQRAGRRGSTDGDPPLQRPSRERERQEPDHIAEARKMFGLSPEPIHKKEPDHIAEARKLFGLSPPKAANRKYPIKDEVQTSSGERQESHAAKNQQDLKELLLAGQAREIELEAKRKRLQSRSPKGIKAMLARREKEISGENPAEEHFPLSPQRCPEVHADDPPSRPQQPNSPEDLKQYYEIPAFKIRLCDLPEDQHKHPIAPKKKQEDKVFESDPEDAPKPPKPKPIVSESPPENAHPLVPQKQDAKKKAMAVVPDFLNNLEAQMKKLQEDMIEKRNSIEMVFEKERLSQEVSDVEDFNSPAPEIISPVESPRRRQKLRVAPTKFFSDLNAQMGQLKQDIGNLGTPVLRVQRQMPADSEGKSPDIMTPTELSSSIARSISRRRSRRNSEDENDFKDLSFEEVDEIGVVKNSSPCRRPLHKVSAEKGRRQDYKDRHQKGTNIIEKRRQAAKDMIQQHKQQWKDKRKKGKRRQSPQRAVSVEPVLLTSRSEAPPHEHDGRGNAADFLPRIRSADMVAKDEMDEMRKSMARTRKKIPPSPTAGGKKGKIKKRIEVASDPEVDDREERLRQARKKRESERKKLKEMMKKGRAERRKVKLQMKEDPILAKTLKDDPPLASPRKDEEILDLGAGYDSEREKDIKKNAVNDTSREHNNVLMSYYGSPLDSSSKGDRQNEEAPLNEEQKGTPEPTLSHSQQSHDSSVDGYSTDPKPWEKKRNDLREQIAKDRKAKKKKKRWKPTNELPIQIFEGSIPKISPLASQAQKDVSPINSQRLTSPISTERDSFDNSEHDQEKSTPISPHLGEPSKLHEEDSLLQMDEEIIPENIQSNENEPESLIACDAVARNSIDAAFVEELEDIAIGNVESSDGEELLVCNEMQQTQGALQEVPADQTLRAMKARNEGGNEFPSDSESEFSHDLGAHEQQSEDFGEMIRHMQQVLAMSQDLIDSDEGIIEAYETIPAAELETICDEVEEDLDEDSISANGNEDLVEPSPSKQGQDHEGLVSQILKKTSPEALEETKELFGITLPEKVLSKMNVSPTEDSPAQLIEAMRVYLEERIGMEKFLKAYHFLKMVSQSTEYDEERFSLEIERILAGPDMEHLQVLSQLIAAEEGLMTF